MKKEERKPNEVLGVIRSPHIGMRDVGRPVLWFEVQELNSSTLQVLSWQQAHDLIEDAGIYEIKQLDGMACVVDHNTENGTSQFLRVLH